MRFLSSSDAHTPTSVIFHLVLFWITKNLLLLFIDGCWIRKVMTHISIPTDLSTVLCRPRLSLWRVLGSLRSSCRTWFTTWWNLCDSGWFFHFWRCLSWFANDLFWWALVRSMLLLDSLKTCKRVPTVNLFIFSRPRLRLLLGIERRLITVA